MQKKSILTTLLCLSASHLFSATSAGTTSTTLDAAMMAENVNLGVVNFDSGDVNLVEQVRALQSDGTFTFVPSAAITVNGMSNTLNGGSTTRGFFCGGAGADGTGSVTISNLTFQSCSAIGGSGNGAGSGTDGSGGGGLGAGGGLFVGENAVVIINDCLFDSCEAVGGAGSAIATRFSAGGGMRGLGRRSFTSGNPCGGGGYGGNANLGFGNGGGASGFAAGNATSGGPGLDFDGGGSAGDPGVGGNTTSVAFNGGFGGGGGAGFSGATGNGGFGGGGGTNETFSTGGNGGFGGGGGGHPAFFTSTGGSGGFGGGGGSVAFGVFSTPGNGGFGGGNGTEGGASGMGAGFGGGIFIQNGGDLTINISSSFTGPLFNNNTAAVPLVGNANTDPLAGLGALGQDMFIMSTGQVTFDLASDVSLSNPIEGNRGDATPSAPADTTTGGLIKRGSSTLELTLENSYTGQTIVEAGKLLINDFTNDHTVNSILTETIVDAGATLAGNFTIKNISSNPASGSLTNSGNVCPGLNGVGRIQLEGNYTQTASGQLHIDITPTGEVNDKIFMTTPMTNVANLAGNMEVILSEGNYIAGTTYTVINAPTLSTTFDTVTKTGSNADNVQIEVLYSSVIILIVDNRIFDDQIIDPGVPTQVKNCILAAVPITPESDFAKMVEKLGTLSNKQVNKALTSLSGVNFGALEWVNERNNSYIADLLSQHLFDLCCAPQECVATVWITPFLNLMDNQKTLDNLPKYNANSVGVLAGIDFSSNPGFAFGGSLGYTRTNLFWKNNGGKGDINTYLGALYGSYQNACFSIDASVIGGGSDNNLQRKILFSNVLRIAKSDPWNYFATGHLGLRGTWGSGCLSWVPFALADYHYFYRNSFNENGANSLNLHVYSKDQQMLRGEAGLKWYIEASCPCYCYAPYFGISWVGEFPLERSKQPASFQGQSCVINATSYDSSVQLISPQIGVKITQCNGFSFVLGYKGLFNRDTRINQAEVQFEWVF